MIKYHKGDFLQSTDKLWAHGCNAQGKFASGIAGQIRKKFSYAYESYINQHNRIGLKLGQTIYAVDTANYNNPIIANCITQEFYGYDGKRYVDYTSIENCLINVMLYAQAEGLSTISMPMIGAGLGGGNWQIIEKILYKVNELNPNININVYSL